MVRTLDLFCGAGLSSHGARKAGAMLVGAVDLDPVAAETYAHNFPTATVFNRRLEEMRPSILRDQVGDIDLLLASPECTNHTCAKGSARRSEKSRETALQVLRYARAFEPRWIVMENVVHMRPWSRYPELLQGLVRLGYNIREQVINSDEFGVPQSRRRLFIMCDREAPPPEIQRKRGPKTRIDARHILDPVTKWDMTPLFKKGRAKDTIKRARRAMDVLGEESSFLLVYYGSDASGGWQRLSRPLRTITTIDRFALVRPTAEGHMMRMLQVPELMRAMGLNGSFQLPVGSRRDKIRLLGNGVCPPVMQHVVKGLTASN